MKVVDGAAALGFGGRKPISSRALARYNRRRCVEAGYPWDGKFSTKEQIDEYFSGDKIICLICGKAFRRLSLHVPKIHLISEDDYRERYGLPWRRGLTSAASNEAYSAAVKDHMDPARMLANLERGREAMRADPPTQRPSAPFVKRAHTERITKKPVAAIFTDSDADEFLRRIASGRTPNEIFKDDDMPGQSWWFAYRKANPEYAERVLATIDAMPFDFQAKCQKIGKRFEIELRRLFDAGMSDQRAASILGVTAMTCNKLTKQWRAK